MTENEAIDILMAFAWNGAEEGDVPLCEALEIGMRAIKEIQAYRAIGTVEDIQEVMALCKELQNMVCKYMDIGSVEKCKEAVERMKPKSKVIRAYDEKMDNHWCSCPICFNGICWETQHHPNFCDKCGTEFDWQ